MAKTIRGVCVYCANEDEITKDHVIPQCLFPDGVPIDAPKVWACEPCNGVIKSRLDTYFRDLLVTDMHSSQSPVAQNLSQKFARALGRNQSKLARDIVQNNQLIELRTESGLFWGHAYTSQEANKKTLEIIAMYVRGLYTAYLHKILPQDAEFDIIRVSKSAALNDVLGLLNEKGGSYARIGNGDIFECVFAHAGDVPEAGIWILNFLRRALFVVIVTPKNLKRPVGVNLTTDVQPANS